MKHSIKIITIVLKILQARWYDKKLVQGLAQIPDDVATQLWVEPLAWGIYP